MAPDYDFILIDTPPSLGLLTLNALCAADGVLVPLQCEYYALEGLSDLQATVGLVGKSLNPGLAIEGILLCMVDTRQNLTEQVAGEVREHFGDRVYHTPIPRNVRLSEAPSFGKPILLYDVASKGAKSYLEAAREFLKRHARRRTGHGMIGKRRALGRGLAALIPEAAPRAVRARGQPARQPARRGPRGRPAGDGLRQVAIEDIHPARHQPRKSFDDERLDELAESIRTPGDHPAAGGARGATPGGFELIAGERRWRAAQRAGLHEVPVVVREVAEQRAFEMALVENLQRADLNPIEEAEGYQRLMAEFGYTQESLAGRVGKDRSTVANALRLLKLPPPVREMVIGGRLSMGHARALLGLDSDAAIERLARQTVARELSVRQVETLVRRERDEERTRPEAGPPRPPSPAARDLVQRLERPWAPG